MEPDGISRGNVPELSTRWVRVGAEGAGGRTGIINASQSEESVKSLDNRLLHVSSVQAELRFPKPVLPEGVGIIVLGSEYLSPSRKPHNTWLFFSACSSL